MGSDKAKFLKYSTLFGKYSLLSGLYLRFGGQKEQWVDILSQTPEP
jgi:hypothetical protein